MWRATTSAWLGTRRWVCTCDVTAAPLNFSQSAIKQSVIAIPAMLQSNYRIDHVKQSFLDGDLQALSGCHQAT